MAVSIKNTTRSALGGARRVYALVAAELLPNWELSLVFVGPKKARELNESLRKKKYTPNVLSYIVGKKSGEIIICPTVAKAEAPAHALSEKDFIVYLFIHGALHIKGWAHGAKMERGERKLMAKYATGRLRTTHVTKNRNRN